MGQYALNNETIYRMKKKIKNEKTFKLENLESSLHRKDSIKKEVDDDEEEVEEIKDMDLKEMMKQIRKKNERKIDEEVNNIQIISKEKEEKEEKSKELKDPDLNSLLSIVKRENKGEIEKVDVENNNKNNNKNNKSGKTNLVEMIRSSDLPSIYKDENEMNQVPIFVEWGYHSSQISYANYRALESLFHFHPKNSF